jgi:hypothetical protein
MVNMATATPGQGRRGTLQKQKTATVVLERDEITSAHIRRF